MPDLFISYSRRDSEQALALVERLRARGIDVWIDQHGIEGAARWRTEIAGAIEESKAVLLLLSAASLASENVLKEMTVASEWHKQIIPVDLEEVTLPRQFMYHLAGVQRTPIASTDAILRSLSRLGIGVAPRPAHDAPPSSQYLQTAPAPSPARTDTRKALMVLPFEDISPGEENSWFSDGLTSELINALSKVKSLRLIDRRTAMEYKGFQGGIRQIATDLSVRYFLEGTVRKFGEQIKITCELIDVEEGEHLWSDSHRGVFDDIFDIQEEMARRVVEGLKLQLAPDEKKALVERGTSSAEAYELLLKAEENWLLQTLEGLRHAHAQLDEALRIDPRFARAYRYKAMVLADLFRTYDRNPAHLSEAERLIDRALELQPGLWRAGKVLSAIYQLQGRLREAEECALEYVRHAPDEAGSHFTLGYLYSDTGRNPEAIVEYKEALRLDPDIAVGYFNLMAVCLKSGDADGARLWSERALPVYERKIRLRPDDNELRAQYTLLLYHAGRMDDVRRALEQLHGATSLDAAALFNLATIYIDLEEHDTALEMLRRSVAAGFGRAELFDSRDFDPVRQRAEFQELLLELERRAPRPPEGDVH